MNNSFYFVQGPVYVPRCSLYNAMLQAIESKCTVFDLTDRKSCLPARPIVLSRGNRRDTSTAFYLAASELVSFKKLNT